MLVTMIYWFWQGIFYSEDEVSFQMDDFKTFEKDEIYNQADAAGFIRLNGLRLQARQAYLGKLKR